MRIAAFQPTAFQRTAFQTGYPLANTDSYVVSYRISGDTVLTASISDTTCFSAIISQSTNIRYMVS